MKLGAAEAPATPKDVDTTVIFLAVPTGYSARYLLRTDVLPTLLRGGAQVVILTPNADEEYLRAEFSDPRISIERLEVEMCTNYYASSRIRRQFVRVRADTLSGGADLITLDDKNQELRRTLLGERPVVASLVRACVWLLRKSRLLRAFFVAVESALFPGNFHADLFKRYRPRAVVTTSVGYFWSDFILMREARRSGVPSIAVVLSWDNPSSKGFSGARPDHVVAWTETMKDELERYLDIAPERVTVGGVAHWDGYHRPERPLEREAFWHRFGLDSRRRVVFLGTKSPRPFPNHDIVQILGRAVQEDRFEVPCQILVRVHPGYFEPGVEAALERMLSLRDRFEHVHFNVPTVLSKRLVLDMPRSEMDDLDAILHNSDVLVNMYSTLAIEAAICDLPTVNVCFDTPSFHIDRDEPWASFRSIHVDARQVHNRRLVESGGVREARTPDELVNHIAQYLKEPSLDSEGRRRIAAREAGPNKGSAGVAVAQAVLQVGVTSR